MIVVTTNFLDGLPTRIFSDAMVNDSHAGLVDCVVWLPSRLVTNRRHHLVEHRPTQNTVAGWIGHLFLVVVMSQNFVAGVYLMPMGPSYQEKTSQTSKAKGHPGGLV